MNGQPPPTIAPGSRPLLIVDDDREIREALQDLLEAEGYSVSTATNGREALGVLEVLRPGLVLLDLMMPIMDGREFMKHLALTDLKDLPVIVISAADLWQISGAVAMVRKPFSTDQLLQLVADHYRAA